MKRITLAELDLMIAEREWPTNSAVDDFDVDNIDFGFLDANAMLPIQMRDELWPKPFLQGYIASPSGPNHKSPLTAVKLAYLKRYWPEEEFELENS